MLASFHSHLQYQRRARSRLLAVLDDKKKHIEEIACELHWHRTQLFRLEAGRDRGPRSTNDAAIGTSSIDQINYSSHTIFRNRDQ